MKSLLIAVSALFALQAFAWDSADEYRHLVSQNRYPEALVLVCELYALDCRHVKFKQKNYPGARAITDSFNRVWVYPGAFTFDRTGAAHAGWLGAIIGHELVHTKQSLVARSLSSFQIKIFGNHSSEAKLETEGWRYMLDNRKKYDLSCFMVLEIEEQLYYYRRVTEFGGHAPKNEDDEEKWYALPIAQTREVIERCKQEKAGH